MKTRKRTARLFAALLAVLLMAVMAMPAFAAYTPITGGSTTIDKYLVMDADANVPNAAFGFAIAPGTAIAGTETTMEVKAGPAGATVTSSLVFAPTDTTYTSVQTGDSVTLASGEKYAKKALTVDFSGVTFDQPGVYRYIVTESGTNQGVTNDSVAARTVDVYVIDNNGTLEAAVYAVHQGTAAPELAPAADPTKTDKYTNRYKTHDLTFEKTVSGNQASKDKYFKFTAEIKGAVPGTKYTVDLSDADASIAANPNSATTCITAAVTHPTELTVGSDGTVTQVFYLKHDQSITIKGIAYDTEYKITEAKEDYTNTPPENASGHMDRDVTVSFLNTRDGQIPTGILMSIIPGLVIILGGIIGVAMVMSRKKRA